MSHELQPGESLDMDTRVGGGVTVTRDQNVADTYSISDHAGELSRYEIRRLAELAGVI